MTPRAKRKRGREGDVGAMLKELGDKWAIRWDKYRGFVMLKEGAENCTTVWNMDIDGKLEAKTVGAALRKALKARGGKG